MAEHTYLITWTTYGTWLPGDERGWVSRFEPGIQQPDRDQNAWTQSLLRDSPVILDEERRRLVEQTIRDHCQHRGWRLHAVNVRTNHVHLVVTADCSPETAMNQFKAWCSRRLNERDGVSGKHWWTRHGSTKWIKDESYLENAIRYVNERQ